MTVSGPRSPGFRYLPVAPQLCTLCPPKVLTYAEWLRDPDWPRSPLHQLSLEGRDLRSLLCSPGILPSSWHIMYSKITVGRSITRSRLLQGGTFWKHEDFGPLVRGDVQMLRLFHLKDFQYWTNFTGVGLTILVMPSIWDFWSPQPNLTKREIKGKKRIFIWGIKYMSKRNEIGHLE